MTLSVPPGTKEQLEAIAERLNIRWGDNPSASGLIAAIAQQQVLVGQSSVLNGEQIAGLRQAVKVLVDAGLIEAAQSILTILLGQGDLEAPLRQALLQQLTMPTQEWRSQLDQFITKKQPFQVSYRNSQGQVLLFHARYAEICFREQRFYVQIWCDETADVEEDIPDLPELWHNRCLRIDRILALNSIEGQWREQLDFIKVYLHFRGSLANAYEPKPDDLEHQVLGNVRQVVRRVVNHFWLIREMSRYWESCEIVAPKAMRRRMQESINRLSQLYPEA